MNRFALAIHGGAGTISRAVVTPEKERAYLDALQGILEEGQKLLAQGGSALDAVTQAVVRLENCPLFNAGHGAVYNANEEHELDASIMDGRDSSAGAVALAQHIKNPILAARAVMESGQCVLIGAGSADEFARAHGLEMVEQSYYSTAERLEQLKKVKSVGGMRLVLDHDAQTLAAQVSTQPNFGDPQKNDPIDNDSKMGTVGAVACDMNGNIAAANSTGGLTNKIPGRIGDSSVIGSGCYADNASAAVATTGTGETFIRGVVAYDICALVKYSSLPLAEAAQRVLEKQKDFGGNGGLVAVNAKGELALPFITEGMYRGSVSTGSPVFTAIYDVKGA